MSTTGFFLRGRVVCLEAVLLCFRTPVFRISSVLWTCFCVSSGVSVLLETSRLIEAIGPSFLRLPHRFFRRDESLFWKKLSSKGSVYVCMRMRMGKNEHMCPTFNLRVIGGQKKERINSIPILPRPLVKTNSDCHPAGDTLPEGPRT